jgi:hypothetical protein
MGAPADFVIERARTVLADLQQMRIRGVQ